MAAGLLALKASSFLTWKTVNLRCLKFRDDSAPSLWGFAIIMCEKFTFDESGARGQLLCSHESSRLRESKAKAVSQVTRQSRS
jgi:hypothetical protein